MDIRKVKKLIELVEESGISELEIAEGDDRVRISRQMATAYAAPTQPVAAVSAAPAEPLQAPSSAAAPLADPAIGATQDHSVKAPMVGTFYSASGPAAAPYVQIGDQVSEGQTLCIIEAMKMMNPIEADRSGRVKSVNCQNGEPVEFDQVLFVLDTGGD